MINNLFINVKPLAVFCWRLVSVPLRLSASTSVDGLHPLIRFNNPLTAPPLGGNDMVGSAPFVIYLWMHWQRDCA
jgi:hypothetical protein